MIGLSVPGNVMTLEGGECVDIPVLLEVKGGKVVVRDRRRLSCPVFRTVDPVEANLYEQRGAVLRRNGEARSVWNLFVRDRSGALTAVRLARRSQGEAAKKRIDEAFRLREGA